LKNFYFVIYIRQLSLAPIIHWCPGQQTRIFWPKAQVWIKEIRARVVTGFKPQKNALQIKNQTKTHS